MKCKAVVVLMCLACIGTAVWAQEPAPLKRVQTLTMDAGITGKFDHMAIDIKGDRLFLTAAQHHSIEVFDLKNGKWMRSISGLGKPAGIVYLPQTNQVVFSDGEPGSCNVIDASTYEMAGTVKLAQDADSMGFDLDASVVYVVNGGKDIGERFSRLTAIDVKARKSLGELKVDGERLEAMALEKSGPRLFLNVTALNKVAVIDRQKNQTLATWDVTDAKENVSMALDEQNHRLFLGTRAPGMLVVLDTENGKSIARLPAAAGVDDLAYDVKHKRIYMSGGKGFVDVYQQKDADTYEAIAKIATGAGARNSKFVPEQNRLYVAVPAGEDGKPAEIQIYEATP